MIPIINNTLDALWVACGFISILVMLALFFPWGFIWELVSLTLIVIWIVFKFWIGQAWRGLKKLFRKKHKWVDVDDHELFI